MLRRVVMIGLLVLGAVAVSYMEASAWSTCCVSYKPGSGPYECDFDIKGVSGKLFKTSDIRGVCEQDVQQAFITGLCQNQGGNISLGRAFSDVTVSAGDHVTAGDCGKQGRCGVQTSTPVTVAQLQEIDPSLWPSVCTEPSDRWPVPTTDPVECVARIFGFDNAAQANDEGCFNASKTWTFIGAVWTQVTVNAQAWVCPDASTPLEQCSLVATSSYLCTSPQDPSVIEQEEPFHCTPTQ